MKSLPQQIEKPLTDAIKNLIMDLSRNNQINEHQRKVAQNQIYDKFQKKYIIKQKLRKQLGDDYQSSGSDQQMDQQYKGLSLIQLKTLTRKKLIKNKYKEDLLSQIKMPQSQKQNIQENQVDSSSDIYQQNYVDKELNVINQKNEIFEQQLRQKKNLYGLKFIINELQKHEKVIIK